MLPKKLRLVTEKEITKAYKTKFRHKTKYFSTLINFKSEPKYLVVISKKISKSAVIRHRIKRKFTVAIANCLLVWLQDNKIPKASLIFTVNSLEMLYLKPIEMQQQIFQHIHLLVKK
jgi:ribonuclease P protein component